MMRVQKMKRVKAERQQQQHEKLSGGVVEAGGEVDELKGKEEETSDMVRMKTGSLAFYPLQCK